MRLTEQETGGHLAQTGHCDVQLNCSGVMALERDSREYGIDVGGKQGAEIAHSKHYDNPVASQGIAV